MAALNARIYMDTNHVIDEISPLLFGGFAEHMARCIYGGIYDPGSPQADARGMRTDVLAALRELNYTIMRYPGGNFVSGYDWRDGVGPKEQRPARRELAWHTIESNQFGTNEFMEFCRDINTIPMLAVNLGTGTPAEAANLMEYVNAPTGTLYADLRKSHGYAEPYGVKYWCLGNEMDGPWQIGHMDAATYGYKARETAKLLRWHEPDLKLTLCGSSSSYMSSYPEWDRVALELCYDQVDYHSLHFYARNDLNDTGNYLAMTALLEDYVDTVAAAVRYVKAKVRSKRLVHLSWDEWNVARDMFDAEGNQQPPHVIETVYTLEDALLVAGWLNVFLRKADVLKMACVAQIVNLLGPILTKTDAMVRQTIFYPFMLFSQFARGDSLDVSVRSPRYTTQQYGDMPVLDVSASYDESTNQGAVFIVNRSLTDTVNVDLVWQDLAPARISAIHRFSGSDPKAENTFAAPNTLLPVTLEGMPVSDKKATVSLPPMSFTTVVCSDYR